MKVLAAPSHRREPNLEENSSGADPSPTPAPTGRLREWNGGVPGHGEFVMLKTQPTHAELKSMHTAAAARQRGVGARSSTTNCHPQYPVKHARSDN